MNAPIKVLDLTPVGRYTEGPVYKFSAGGLPSRGVRAAGAPEGYDTPETAFNEGCSIVTRYEEADRFGNMGCVLGVTKLPSGKYRPVINTYHSNT